MRLKAEDDTKIILLHFVLLHCTESMNIFWVVKTWIGKEQQASHNMLIIFPIYNIPKQSKY